MARDPLAAIRAAVAEEAERAVHRALADVKPAQHTFGHVLQETEDAPEKYDEPTDLPQPPVHHVGDRLHDYLDKLHCLISDLERRLEPVSSEVVADATAPLTGGIAGGFGSSHIARRIGDAGGLVQHAHERLHQILDRLEV